MYNGFSSFTLKKTDKLDLVKEKSINIAETKQFKVTEFEIEIFLLNKNSRRRY